MVKLESKGIPKVFWLYLAAVALIAAEYVDFPLIYVKKIRLLTIIISR